MAIRYFKCHTLPFPSYDLSGTAGTSGSVLLSWSNGPPGQATPTAHIEYASLAATASTTVATVSGTLETAKIDGIAVIAPADYRFRLRRQNSAGFGEWTPFVTVKVQP